MSFFISDALAEAAPAAAAPDLITSMILPIGLVVLFYFFLIRPQSKRAKEHKAMIASIQKGEEITTTGGLLGKVTNVGDNFVSLDIGNGIIIHVQKHAVQTVMPKGTIKDLNNDNK
jgi:preprotein translocase subunit YajC